MSRPLHKAAPRSFAWWASWAAIVAAGLVLRVLETPQYIFAAGDDDELMVKMAQGFVHGHWSTPWSVTGTGTLAKSVGFPIFLAVSHFLPWSPLVTVYLVYLAGAGLAAWSWGRMSGSRAQATIVLAALAFDPVLFAGGNQRIYRDSCIDAVATLAVGLAFVAAAELQRRFASGTAARRRRRLPSVLWLLVLVPCGLTAGLVAITKPTWYWLLIAVAAAPAYPALVAVVGSKRRLVMAGRVALAAIVVGVSCFAVIEGTKYMNKRTYGVALVEDLSSGGLAAAWKAWASIEAGPPEKDNPITKAMRFAAYRASPTARLMEPFLESPSDPWRLMNCHDPHKACEGSGKFFEWDMQSAAVASGRVHSAVQFQAFFDAVADQIHRACDSGDLRCTSSPVLATGLPPLEDISLHAVAGDATHGVWQMLLSHYNFGPAPMKRPPVAVYELWTSVVPGIAPIGKVANSAAPAPLYSALRVVDDAYSVANLAGLVVLVLGPICLVLVYLRRRRPAFGADRAAALTSLVFLVSTFVAMGTLAVFNVAQSQTYINPLYWSDFATPAELFLVFGAFASWPLLPGALRRKRPPESTPAA